MYLLGSENEYKLPMEFRDKLIQKSIQSTAKGLVWGVDVSAGPKACELLYDRIPSIPHYTGLTDASNVLWHIQTRLDNVIYTSHHKGRIFQSFTEIHPWLLQ